MPATSPLFALFEPAGLRADSNVAQQALGLPTVTGRLRSVGLVRPRSREEFGKSDAARPAKWRPVKVCGTSFTAATVLTSLFE